MEGYNLDIEEFMSIEKVMFADKFGGVIVTRINNGMDLSANMDKPKGTIVLSHLVQYPDGVTHGFLVDNERKWISVVTVGDTRIFGIPEESMRATKELLQIMMKMAGEDVSNGTVH